MAAPRVAKLGAFRWIAYYDAPVQVGSPEVQELHLQHFGTRQGAENKARRKSRQLWNLWRMAGQANQPRFPDLAPDHPENQKTGVG